VKAIPAGGYVRIAGMNPLVDDVPPGDEHRSYYAKPLWQRALVILAGPMSHFLVAAILFSILFFAVGDPDPAAPWRLSSVGDTIDGRPAPARVAGLEPGDVLLRIDDVDAPSDDEITSIFANSIGEPVTILVGRGDRTIEVVVEPTLVTEDGVEYGRIGVLVEPTHRVSPGVLPALGEGFAEVGILTKESVLQIGRIFGPSGIMRTGRLLFTDEPRDRTDSVSVVGIGQQVGSIGDQGKWADYLYVFAYVTLFIGIINLIPLPPLDGGHLAVLLIERVRGTPVDMKRMIPVSAAVLVFLALFTMANLTLDIVKPVPIP
jgi:membrane-associated protease RseP (regulator of RpoE activity)